MTATNVAAISALTDISTDIFKIITKDVNFLAANVIFRQLQTTN